MSRSVKGVVSAFLVAAIAGYPSLVIADSTPEYCQAGRPARKLVVFFSERIPESLSGMPLDRALEREQLWVERIRDGARRRLESHPTPALLRMMEEYTLLLPASVREKYDVGALIGMSSISTAVRYRSYLWKSYIERFSSVKEAPGKDPYTLRFEVSLDLDLFCRYRRQLKDLVAT